MRCIEVVHGTIGMCMVVPEILTPVVPAKKKTSYFQIWPRVLRPVLASDFGKKKKYFLDPRLQFPIPFKPLEMYNAKNKNKFSLLKGTLG